MDDLDAWPVLYWWIDGGSAVQNTSSPLGRRSLDDIIHVGRW